MLIQLHLFHALLQQIDSDLHFTPCSSPMFIPYVHPNLHPHFIPVSPLCSSVCSPMFFPICVSMSANIAIVSTGSSRCYQRCYPPAAGAPAAVPSPKLPRQMELARWQGGAEWDHWKNRYGGKWWFNGGLMWIEWGLDGCLSLW